MCPPALQTKGIFAMKICSSKVYVVYIEPMLAVDHEKQGKLWDSYAVRRKRVCFLIGQQGRQAAVAPGSLPPGIPDIDVW